MTRSNDPKWWTEALELESAGKIEAAEKKIVHAVKDIGAYSQVAYLHELRMARLIEQGDLKGARKAFDRAADWLTRYASCATSGGEGMALSAERAERLAVMQWAMDAAKKP